MKTEQLFARRIPARSPRSGLLQSARVLSEARQGRVEGSLSSFRIRHLSAPIASSATRFAMLPTHHTFSFKNAPATPVFSNSSALPQNSAHLIENKGQMPFCNPSVFYQFRTLFHSSPASPVLSICSPKHTGGIPPPSHPTPEVPLQLFQLNYSLPGTYESRFSVISRFKSRIARPASRCLPKRPNARPRFTFPRPLANVSVLPRSPESCPSQRSMMC
jgi:hypothetical protein